MTRDATESGAVAGEDGWLVGARSAVSGAVVGLGAGGGGVELGEAGSAALVVALLSGAGQAGSGGAVVAAGDCGADDSEGLTCPGSVVGGAEVTVG